MRFSIQLIVGFIVLMLLAASAIALYFASSNEYTIPLIMVALINAEALAFLVFLITRGIILPLNRIRDAIKKVGEGDFSTRIKSSTAKEIREFGESINEMIQKLETAKKREAQIDKLKTEFISLAAHQLRTPLAQIKWTLQSFLDGDMGKIGASQKEAISNTMIFNERMIRLVNDLLNITRIEEGRYLFQRANEQLEDLASEMVQSYQNEAAHKKLTLSLQVLDQHFPPIFMDKEKMRLALQNLIENALRYTSEGGAISIALLKGSGGIELAIKDTGIGIPKDEQPRVFERFFRAKNAKTVQTEGTGLGLYLTRNIVEAHGGKIWFETEEKKGTTFHITLPYANS